LLLRAGRARKGVTIASALAAVVVVTTGVSVLLFYPTLSGSNGPTLQTGLTTMSTSAYVLPANSSTTVTSSTSAHSPPETSTTTGSVGWQPWAVANITLNYYKDMPYVRFAWNYTYSIQQTGSNPVLVSNVIQTLGPLTVYGNWTTGYTLNYTRVLEFNVTVQYTPPDSYQVIGFSSLNYTVPFQTLQFNSTQQRAISVAATNSNVKSYLNQYFGPFFFVDDAFPFPPANQTYGGDYLVWFYQTDGAGILAAIVNTNTGAVVSTYTSSRVTETCYPNGICFSSPWVY
jgi:hypothetical protein